MSRVGVIVLARGGREASVPFDLGVAVVVVGQAVGAAAARTVPWPAGSGVGYAVNAGVEALEAEEVDMVVTLDAALVATAGLVDRLRMALEGAAAVLPAPGASAPFAAAAFSVDAWRRLGGVDEGYLDVFVDADFAQALRAIGEKVVELPGPSLGAGTDDVPLRRWVRNEFMYRSRWGSSVRLWHWAARRVLGALGRAGERREVVGGIADGWSWRHTHRLMERSA
jgi:hypothetical protein